MKTRQTQFIPGRKASRTPAMKDASESGRLVINVTSHFQFCPPVWKGREKERLPVTVTLREGTW